MENELFLQGAFLETLCREKVPVSVYLMNGIKLQGTIRSHDLTVIILENASSQMVYKHAVSTIVPVKDISLNAVLNHQYADERAAAIEEA